MKKILLLLSFIALFSEYSFAQQDAQFSQYMYNSFYYNPAFAGLEPYTRFTLISRKQWLNYQPTQYSGGSPFSNIFSVATPLPILDGKCGAGAYFFTDNLGPLTITQFNVSGSYHLTLGKGILGIGVRAGFLSQSTNTGEYRVVDPNDQIYKDITINSKQSQLKPDISGGVFYKTPRYYVGLSADHLNSPNYNLGAAVISSKLNSHVYFTGGYSFKYGTIIDITPTVLVQTDINQLTYLFGPTVTYNEKFWVGLNARQSFAKKDISKGGKTLSNDDIILYLGINLLKNKQNNNALRIGYSLDFVTSGVVAKKRTSHELMLSYIIPSPWSVLKPKVRTPRYRHDEN